MERADQASAITASWIRSLERAEPEERQAILCFLAGQKVVIDPGERNAAVRRAELLLATGGAPRRRLELRGRAVTSLADDLDRPERRHALQDALDALAPELAGLHAASESLRLLTADPELAWQTFALAVLADALTDDD